MPLFSIAANIKEFKFSHINSSSGLSDNQVRSIIQAEDGRMIFTTEGNLNIYDGVSFKYIHRRDANIIALTDYNGFYRVYKESDSLLWIKDNHKLMCLSLSQERYLDYLEIEEIVGKSQLKDLFVDSECNTWCLMTNDSIYDRFGNRIYANAENGVVIQDMICRNNNIYLLYNNGMLKIIDKCSGRLCSQQMAYNKQIAHLYENTSNILETSDGFYQIRNGIRSILLYYDFKSECWSEVIETTSWLNTIALDEKGNLLVSCKDGLWSISGDHSGKFIIKSLISDNNNIIRSEISSVYTDRDGGIWLGTLNKGILYTHSDRYKLDYYGRSCFDSESDDDIYVLGFVQYVDSVLIKTNNGVYIFDQHCNAIRKISGNIHLEKETINSLNKLLPSYSRRYSVDISLKDKSGNIWIGSKYGLILETSNDTLTLYTEDGLINNNIKSIVETGSGKIFVSTSHGVSEITLDSCNIITRNYNKSDGALPDEYIEGSSLVTNNGDIFFGGINGFNIIRSRESSDKEKSSPPLLRSVSVHGQRLSPGNKYLGQFLIDNAPSFTDNLVLAHDQNFFAFEYAALNYKNNAHTSFKYILEGIDESPIISNVDSDNSGSFRVSYTSVPPGEYKLRVWSSFRNGEWTEARRPLNIIVKRPWWKTSSAYAIYAIAIVMTIVSFMRIYAYVTKRQLEIKHKEEMLLMKIKGLVEECDRYQSLSGQNNIRDTKIEDKGEMLSEEQSGFISKAIEFVEKNLKNNYSVEQLSRDMCMDRTGLYKKLNSALDISPSIFIRSIRLRRAAQLIEEERFSLTEISDMVGFSSPSYMSKCFVEEFGCKPSEYILRRNNNVHSENS